MKKIVPVFVALVGASIGLPAHAQTPDPDYIPYNYTIISTPTHDLNLEQGTNVLNSGGPAGGGSQGYVEAGIAANPNDPNDQSSIFKGVSLDVDGDVTWVWNPDGTAMGPPDFDHVQSFTGGHISHVSTNSWCNAYWDANSVDWYGGYNDVNTWTRNDIDVQVFPKTGSTYVDCDFWSYSVWALEPRRYAGSAGSADIQMLNNVGTTIVW